MQIVSGGDVQIRLAFKTPASASGAVLKFNQPADGKVLSVPIAGATTTGTTLSGRLGGADGLDLVQEKEIVDVLMDAPDNGS